MTVDSFVLSAVVMQQTQRFFAAAAQAVERLAETDQQMLGTLVTLSANMLWAHSGARGVDPAQGEAMAERGALLSALGERTLRGGLGNLAGALQTLDALEAELIEGHDALLEMLLRDLQAQGLGRATPGQLQAAVWKRLFPGYPHACGQKTLCQAIVRRLRGETAGGAPEP